MVHLTINITVSLPESKICSLREKLRKNRPVFREKFRNLFSSFFSLKETGEIRFTK